MKQFQKIFSIFVTKSVAALLWSIPDCKLSQSKETVPQLCFDPANCFTDTYSAN